MDTREEGRGVGDLLGDLGRQVSTLVRKEIDLARVELTSTFGSPKRTPDRRIFEPHRPRRPMSSTR